MTLILTALTPNNIVQVSDRCVTYERGDGTVRYEDGHNKTVLFGQATIFSSPPPGLAPSKDGQPTSG